MEHFSFQVELLKIFIGAFILFYLGKEGKEGREEGGQGGREGSIFAG